MYPKKSLKRLVWNRLVGNILILALAVMFIVLSHLLMR